MKKFVLLLILFCAAACQENQKTTSETKNSEGSVKVKKICFLTVGNEIRRGDKVLRDSTILKLTINGEAVKGIYHWLPAEKDSRRGTIKANKNGQFITGKYSFVQEGKKQVQPVSIRLKENSACVVTGNTESTKMKMKIEKITCEL